MHVSTSLQLLVIEWPLPPQTLTLAKNSLGIVGCCRFTDGLLLQSWTCVQSGTSYKAQSALLPFFLLSSITYRCTGKELALIPKRALCILVRKLVSHLVAGANERRLYSQATCLWARNHETIVV